MNVVFTDNLINLLKPLNVVNLLIKVCLSHICFLWRCCSAGSWSDIRDKLITFLTLISMNKESIKEEFKTIFKLNRDSWDKEYWVELKDELRFIIACFFFVYFDVLPKCCPHNQSETFLYSLL